MAKKEKKYRRYVLGFFFLMVLVSLWHLNHGVIAQEKQLEVVYPEIKGIKPESVSFDIAEYAKYIFNAVIVISGFIAFGALIWAGIDYFLSAGKPEKIKEAKKRIKSVLLGILILLFSYLILITIDPQLVIFQLPGIRPIPENPVSEEIVPEQAPVSLLERIRDLAEKVKQGADLINNTAQQLKSLTDNCDCGTTQSMCICGSGGGMGGGFSYGSLLGDFSGTSNYLSGFQGANLNAFDSYLSLGGSLSQFNTQLSGVNSQLLSGTKIYMNSGQFSGAKLTSLSFSSAKAKNFFGNSFNNILNQSSIYILNNSGYKNLINTYISQAEGQGLFQGLAQKNLFSSQLLGTYGAYLYNGTEFLMAFNGDAMLNGGTKAFIHEFAHLIDGTVRRFSNSAKYLAIFKKAQAYGAFVNNYARIGGVAEDFAETISAYYTYGVPSFLSDNRQIQSSFKERFDYFRDEGIVGDLQPDLEYLYDYSGTGVQPYDIPLSSSFNSQLLQTDDQLVPDSKTYVIGEFSDSERAALENGFNTAIEYYNPRYHDLLRQTPTYIADQNEYTKIAEVYASEQYLSGSITEGQRDQLTDYYARSTGGLADREGNITLNGPTLLTGGEYSAFGVGPVTTAIHEYGHRIDNTYHYSDSPEWTEVWNRSIDYRQQNGTGGWVNDYAAKNTEEDFAWTVQSYYSSYGNPAYVSTDRYGNPPDPETQKLIQERFDYIRNNQIIQTQEWY